MWILVYQRLAFEFFIDFFVFPFWWYSQGLVRSLRFSFALFQMGNGDLAPLLWLKNLLVPMYGQYDWQGRLMSFFMRLANFFIRLFALCVWAIICLLLFLLWIVLPLLVLFILFRSVV